MARQEGLEPPTYCLEGSCSIQLSYWRIYGAGDGNRTRVSSLEGWCSTIELHPQTLCIDSAIEYYHDFNQLSRGSIQNLGNFFVNYIGHSTFGAGTDIGEPVCHDTVGGAEGKIGPQKHG